MCTLTFIPGDDGYILGMNRDEQIARGLAVPPRRVQMGKGQAVYPTDTEGGTWIGVNDSGLAFALLNRNGGQLSQKARSRGEIILQLLAMPRIEEARAVMQNSDLAGILPFRLVGVSATEKAVVEWQWDEQRLEGTTREWKLRHWFSSSLSDEQARVQRGAVCDSAWTQPDGGSLPWLRRLHASHGQGPGPFSICVHRADVETLSYSEIECSRNELGFRYFSGCPCGRRQSAQPTVMARAANQGPCI